MGRSMLNKARTEYSSLRYAFPREAEPPRDVTRAMILIAASSR